MNHTSTLHPLHRSQTLGEEIANSISHGIGFLGAIAVTPFLIIAAIPLGAAAITGTSIFGATMILLYLSSTLYHAIPPGKTKRLFQLFDHGAIFLLIAGTYTPFTLALLPGAWGWTLFGIVWSLAVIGILLKSVRGVNTGWLSTALYLGMGWLAVLAIKPMWETLSTTTLLWILAGGLIYSAGVLFYAYDHRFRYGHFVWHLFVIGGTACHVVAVMLAFTR